MADINSLLAQKLAELSQNELDNESVAKIDEIYKQLILCLTEDVPIQTLQQVGQALLDFQLQLQLDEYVQRRRAKEENQEKDQLLHKEYPTLQDKRIKVEQTCREIDASIKKINETIKKLPEIEEANRKQMKEKFYDDLKEVKAKIETEDTEAKQFAEENLKIREEMQELIKQYEQREKDFWEKVKQNEEEQKNDTKKYMEHFEKMQGDAQKAMQDKQLIQEASKQLNDKKMKLSLYKGKQDEFVETFEKSTTTFQNLKTEFLKLGFKVKEDEEKYLLNQTRAEKANLLALEIAQKNVDVKQQLANVEKEKEKIRSEILEIKNKRQQQNQQKDEPKVQP